MKKIILTAIVILACAVNAANTPWDGNGNPEWHHGNPTNLDQVYTATKGNVQFAYKWGSAHKNQMLTYERIGADVNTGWKYEDGMLEFTSDFVWTNFDTQTDIRHNVSLGNVIEYGYYTIGADGQANDPITLFRENTEGTAENSVIFKKGDKIGIYMTINEDGTPFTITSSKSNIEGASVAVPNVDTNSRGNEKQYFCLFDNRQGKGIGDYSHYEFHFGGLIASNGSYEEFLEQVIEQNDGNTNITDSTGNPVSGQPLPGTLATILISGLCAKALSKKNKKH